jgi:hypothetical protein
MIKSAFLALVTSAAMLGAGSAHARGGVSWSIGINTPVVGTVISNAPAYGYGPVYAPVYAAEPVYAPPVPVYRAAPWVGGYYPRPIYYRSVPVVYPRYYYPGWRHGYGRDHHGRWDGRR